ncbi:hypothetical protein HPB47_006588 [Ixodes persulcatus]|uniref:Uncharacterized protein n=1 Tax=Ixodes persulcatus TaxID=34615 RepID=A0AC60P9Q3_IXOPE|nr:hypothetical protein HPB47_006588 [Ixodes persulcatus]
MNYNVPIQNAPCAGKVRKGPHLPDAGFRRAKTGEASEKSPTHVLSLSRLPGRVPFPKAGKPEAKPPRLSAVIRIRAGGRKKVPPGESEEESPPSQAALLRFTNRSELTAKEAECSDPRPLSQPSGKGDHRNPHKLLQDVNAQTLKLDSGQASLISSIEKIPRDRPILTDDAVPTVFPNLPAYLSKPLPKKRRTKTSSEGLPSKAPRADIEGSDSAQQLNDADLPCTSTSVLQGADLQGCALPNNYWGSHLVSGAPEIVVFSVCEMDGGTVGLERSVVFNTSNGICALVIVQGATLKTVQVENIQEAEDLLREVQEMKTCMGLGEVQDLDELLRAKCKHRTFGRKVFSLKCTGTVQSQNSRCVQCKYLRKLLLQ